MKTKAKKTRSMATEIMVALAINVVIIAIITKVVGASHPDNPEYLNIGVGVGFAVLISMVVLMIGNTFFSGSSSDK